MFLMNLGLEQFKTCFATPTAQEPLNPLAGMTELEDGDCEWQCELECDLEAVSHRLLCCPEDIEKSHNCAVDANPAKICKACHILLRRRCAQHLKRNAHSGCRSVLPMGLCNDNFWGYTTSLLTTLDVRWIEAAIVNPYWTTMLIYYIEGDRGH